MFTTAEQYALTSDMCLITCEYSIDMATHLLSVWVAKRQGIYFCSMDLILYVCVHVCMSCYGMQSRFYTTVVNILYLICMAMCVSDWVWDIMSKRHRELARIHEQWQKRTLMLKFGINKESSASLKISWEWYKEVINMLVSIDLPTWPQGSLYSSFRSARLQEDDFYRIWLLISTNIWSSMLTEQYYNMLVRGTHLHSVYT